MITVTPPLTGTGRPVDYTGRHRRAGGEERLVGPAQPGRCADRGRHRAGSVEAARGPEATHGEKRPVEEG